MDAPDTPPPGGPAPGGDAPAPPPAASPPPPPPPPLPLAPDGQFLPPGPAPGLVYATAGVRVVAWIVDMLVIGVIEGGVGAILGLGFLGLGGLDLGRPDRLPGFGGIGWVAWLAIVTVISGLYFVGLWTRSGATFGQLLFSMEVRNAADGARLEQDQAIRRWAFLTVPVLSSLPGIGFFVFLYQLFLLYTTANDPAKQGFHDRQAGTVVVRRQR